MEKKDFKKINDYLWEIPKSFRADMRVPARIYVSDKMLEDVFRDRSLEQLINLCCLPGIQKYGLAMPDIHEGYSSPIGGVAAIRITDGIISPGMQGYDINCLHPDSIINLDFGTNIAVKNLKKHWQNIKVTFLSKKKRQIKEERIINFFSQPEEKFLYHIKTKTGFSLKVTANHPIYTIDDMKEAKSLKNGERLVIYPFSGVTYTKPQNRILINEEKIKKTFAELKIPNNGNRWNQIIKWLKDKNLINLSYNSYQLPFLIKTLGYLFGDGNINFSKKSKRGVISFYGKLEDLQQIQKDLVYINIKSKIYSRRREHKIKGFYQKLYKFNYTEYSLRLGSTSAILLFYLLGAPIGNKTYRKISLPRWLGSVPLWQKRLFLAAFFGAELSKPATLNKFNFYGPTLNINKAIIFKRNGIDFLEKIKILLDEFSIKTSKVTEVEELGNPGKTIGLRFQILSTPVNLLRFFKVINFEYNKKKKKLACLAVSYLQFKEKVIEERNRVRDMVKSLYKTGIPARELVKQYSNSYIGRRFIEHSIWSLRGEPRIAYNFPSFDAFIKQNAYGEEGLVIDEIESITKENYQGLVYDLTINHPDHNFIANNFVVSNCGMKLLKSNYLEKDIKSRLEDLATEIQKEVPSGLGRGRQIKLSIEQIDKILEDGAQRLVEQRYGEKEDIENCEAGGKLPWADATAVSSHAKNRGRDQVGTLGSGNHFLEIQKVEEIFDEKVAEVFGLSKDQIVIMIHTGSRGFGHQVCTDYLREFIPLMEGKYKIRVPDREFACVPFSSPEGQRAFAASGCAANYAWANRQMIAHFIRKAWKSVLGEKASPLVALYDVAHNIIKKEKYKIDDKEIEVAIHRKGATRAFPPGHPEIPEKYREVGQPVLIPGSMGTASYVLVGTKDGEEAFFSTCHGAGRTMSRHEAMRRVSGGDVVRNLESKGIIVKCWSSRGIAEEAPIAYKNIDSVVEVVHNAGLSKKVAKLVPLAVIKGE